MLNFDYWNGNSRYTRFEHHVTWKGDTATVKFKCQELGGGGKQKLQGAEYSLRDYYTGDVLDTVTVEPGATGGAFKVDVGKLADGWLVLDMTAHGTETAIPFPVYVLRGELPAQQWTPVWTGSSGHGSHFHLHWVRVDGEQKAMPLPRREYPHFDHVPAESNLYFETPTGTLESQARRIFRTKDGVLTTATRQWYTWNDLVRKLPRLPLLDGPCGVNSLGYPTHISVGVARQEDDATSAPLDNLYVTTPWSLCRVSPEGAVKTLAGYRHKGVPTYWNDPPELELVGDWSGVPEDEPRGFHEIWGGCVVPATVRVDEAAPRIPEEGNRHPHLVDPDIPFKGPTFIAADSQNNRLAAVEHSATSHATPAKVTVFAKGDDYWDCVAWHDRIIASERGAHRVVELDIHGNVTRVIAQGAALAAVDFNRFVIRTAPLDMIQAEQVVLPEGLYVVGDWLYIASSAMAMVQRRHLVDEDRPREVIVKFGSGGVKADNYWKIAVSDGTALPEGTIFLTDWTVSEFGGPAVYAPDGTKMKKGLMNPYNSRFLHRGKGGGGFSSIGYSAAVAAKNGRVVFGSSYEGLRAVSLALPTDKDVDRDAYSRGRKLWRSLGYGLKFGGHAQNRFGESLPWGEHPDMDEFMRICGAVR